MLTWEDIKETGRIVFGIIYDDDTERRANTVDFREARARYMQRLQEADSLDGDAEREADADAVVRDATSDW